MALSGKMRPVPIPESGEFGRVLHVGPYLYWVTKSWWNPEKKNAEDDRKSIGRIHDSDPGLMWPNDYFLTLFAERPIAQSTNHKRTLGFGTYIFARKAAANIGVIKALQEAFPREWERIFALCVEWIEEESDVSQNFGYWFEENYCGIFTKLDPPAISRLYEKISKNEYARERYRVTFLKEYGAAFPLAGGNQKRVVGCDSTNSNTTDADNEKAGYGHAKEDKNIPVVNTMSYVDEATGITIYCENFPGPVLDKSQISYSLEKSIKMGYEQLHLMFDRGFITKANARFLQDIKAEYGIVFSAMVPSTFAFVHELTNEYKDVLYNNSAMYIDSQKLYGMKIGNMTVFEDERREFSEDVKDLFDVFLFYDDLRAARERKNILDKYQAFLNAVLERKIYTENLVKEAAPFVLVTPLEKKEEGREFTAVINHEKRQEELDYAGYFITVSDANGIGAEEEITIARHRDRVEKSYRRRKSFFGLVTPGTEKDETYNGKMFVADVAQNVVEAMEYYGRSFTTARTSDTINTMIRELHAYKGQVNDDSSIIPSNYMGTRQKDIFSCLGLTPDIVERYMRSLEWGKTAGDIYTNAELKAAAKAKKQAQKEEEKARKAAERKAQREAERARKAAEHKAQKEAEKARKAAECKVQKDTEKIMAKSKAHETEDKKTVK